MKTINCEKCKNTGYIIYTGKDGYEYATECECVKQRRSLKLAERSGLGDMLSIYTFDKFKTDLEWQESLKNKALQYCKDKTNKWFVVVGQSGGGKTFISTAICGELLNQGLEVQYTSWLELSGNLKRHVNDTEYDTLIEPLKNCEVLYIDDFFKSNNDTPPTPADIKLANEILNYRYNKARISNKPCKTIISSERLITQLIGYDEAIAGRIVEMSTGYMTQLTGREKNYRLKGLF